MVSLALKLTSGGVWAHKIIINHGAAAAAIVAISASLHVLFFGNAVGANPYF